MLISLLSALAFAQEPPPPPIVNGSETSGFLPVGVIVAVDGQYGFDFCSGTLIQSKWAATAAHCIDAAVEYENYGYEIYFITGEDLYAEDWFAAAVVTDLIPHPNYNSTNLRHDIGLLELQTSMAWSGTYDLNTDSPSTFSSGADVTYVGWGITGDNDKYSSGVKRTVDIDLYTYDENFIYTYEPGVNICSGDSGGAALMKKGSDYELVGVNSFTVNLEGGSPSCEAEGAAAGSTRIDNHIDWIAGYVELGDSGDSDADTDADTDSDTDADADADTDSDADADTDADADDDADTGDRPPRPVKGDDGDDKKGLCSAVPAAEMGGLALVMLAGAVIRRRETRA